MDHLRFPPSHSFDTFPNHLPKFQVIESEILLSAEQYLLLYTDCTSRIPTSKF